MIFAVRYLSQRAIGKSQYIKDEYSLFFQPWNTVDFSILIGESGVGLDVRSDTMRVLQLTGYLPYPKWVKAVLSPPEGRPGELMVKDANPHGISGVGIDYTMAWAAFFDAESGWICLGSTAYDQTMDAVEFAQDTIAVVKDGRLIAIWVRPQFIP